MEAHDVISLALIIILGGGAQWIAWRFHLPSILLLLIVGFVSGPVTGAIDPDRLFGDGLFPFISLAVAVILFEGGLSLRFADIKGHGRVVRDLISVGVLVGWVLTGAAAHFILGFEPEMAALLGAVLSVSGPTVIIPLLRHLRPAPHLGSILRWEGILVDSVGALLAILTFEFVVRTASADLAMAAVSILKTVVFGTAIGAAAAGAVVVALKRYWVPDFLHIEIALMAVLGAFVGANAVQHESGLFAVTVMGIALINQRQVSIKHIVEFKETLRTLLIASLFIVLAARMRIEDLRFVDGAVAAFLAVLMLVVRPAVVAASTRGSSLTGKERAFLAALYPRGIVAAAVSSVFAFRLAEMGYPGAERFAPIAFFCIIASVAVYGLLARPVGRSLGVTKPDPQGALIVGSHPWARALAKTLLAEGVAVQLVDNNRANVAAARLDGIPAFYARSFNDLLSDEIELGGMGRLFALTSSHELNSLVTLHFLDVFGRKEVYQLAVEGARETEREPTAPHLCGRFLFGKDVTYRDVTDRFAEGASVKATRLTGEFDFDAFTARDPSALPLCLVDENGKVAVFAADAKPRPKAGQKLISVALAPA
jgi:NhaP-type Na+/H+ or K+/H+ antiporter